MLKVKDLAIELSIKLGDPRQDNGDGTLFWRNDRLRYIERGYGKLLRTLSMAMRKYKPNFVLPLVPIEWSRTLEVQKNPYVFTVPIINLEEVIVYRTEEPGGEVGQTLMASKLDSSRFNQVKFDLDETNKASASNIFYTMIDNQLYLLPDDGKYQRINAMGIKDLTTLTYEVENIETTIPIDKVYSDLLITLAAIEAMNDLPNPQKVQLYRGELIDHISVLANYTNLMERREGEKGNG